MKIAILTDGIFSFVIGGMQKHSFYLTKYLTTKGVDVHLVHCVAHDQSIPEEREVRRAMDLGEEAKFTHTCLRFPKPDWMPGHYIKESYAFSREVFKSIQPQLDDFDFIYAKGFAAWNLIERKQKGLKTPPVSVKFHGYEMFQKPANFKMRLEQILLRGPVKYNNIHADYVFSYGGKITPLIKNLGVNLEKIIEIPTGIEASWCLEDVLSSDRKKLSFLFVGRYERRKGIEELNQVLRSILQNEVFNMHFIGPIPDDKKIRSENIIYHGKIMEKKGIQDIMARCDVLVTPSHSEGMPNVIMEGMSRGLAVIATDVGAVCDEVGKDMGWLINPGDTTALQKAMVEAIHLDADKLQEKKRQALEKVKNNFTWEHVSDLTIQELNKLLEVTQA